MEGHRDISDGWRDTPAHEGWGGVYSDAEITAIRAHLREGNRLAREALVRRKGVNGHIGAKPGSLDTDNGF